MSREAIEQLVRAANPVPDVTMLATPTTPDPTLDRVDTAHPSLDESSLRHERTGDWRHRRRRLVLALGIAASVVAVVAVVAVVGPFDESRTPFAPVQPSPAGDTSTTYRAVFLREAPSCASCGPDLVVVSVDAQGRETELARLPSPHLGSGGTSIFAVGAVSRTGLLALPAAVGETRYRWQIIDLHDPDAAAVSVPGIERAVEPFLRDKPYLAPDARGGVFWGPGDRLAIVTYEHNPTPDGGNVDTKVALFDGRTGDLSYLDIPDGLLVQPAWAADGSGVLVGQSFPETEGSRAAPWLLRPDGALVDATAADVETFCETPPGLTAQCRAPDDSMTVRWQHDNERGYPQIYYELVRSDGRGVLEIPGSFAGWIAVTSAPTSAPPERPSPASTVLPIRALPGARAGPAGEYGWEGSPGGRPEGMHWVVEDPSSPLRSGETGSREAAAVFFAAGPECLKVNDDQQPVAVTIAGLDGVAVEPYEPPVTFLGLGDEITRGHALSVAEQTLCVFLTWHPSTTADELAATAEILESIRAEPIGDRIRITLTLPEGWDTG